MPIPATQPKTEITATATPTVTNPAPTNNVVDIGEKAPYVSDQKVSGKRTDITVTATPDFYSSNQGQARYDNAGNKLTEITGQPVNTQINYSNPNNPNAGASATNGNNSQYRTNVGDNRNNGGAGAGAGTSTTTTDTTKITTTGGGDGYVKPTETQEYKDGAKIEKQFYDNLISNTQSKINNLNNLANNENDPELQSKINNITFQYDNLIQQQQRTNTLNEGISKFVGLQNGSVENTPFQQASAFNDIISQGADKVAKLVNDKNNAIQEAISAFKGGNTRETERLTDKIAQYKKDYNSSLNTLEDNIRAQQQAEYQRTKDLQTTYFTQRKVAIDEIATSYDVYADIFQNGSEKEKTKLVQALVKEYGVDENSIIAGLSKAKSNYNNEQRKIKADERADKKLDLVISKINGTDDKANKTDILSRVDNIINKEDYALTNVYKLADITISRLKSDDIDDVINQLYRKLNTKDKTLFQAKYYSYVKKDTK